MHCGLDYHLLACPRCNSEKLISVVDGLVCKQCSEWFESINGCMDMFPYWEFYGPRRRHWLYWRKTQENAATFYRNDPANNLSTAGRQDVFDFAKFCTEANLSDESLILDVGSGILPDGPSYLTFKNRLGIEPLLPEKSTFPLIRGVAEFMPFRAGLFDACFIGTSIDHFLFPTAAFREMHRCMTPSGKLLVWAATFPKPVSLVPALPWPAEMPTNGRSFQSSLTSTIESISKLAIHINRFVKKTYLEGFSYFPVDLQYEGIQLNIDDPYHLGHYGNDQIGGILASCGFQKKRQQTYRTSDVSDVIETFAEYEKAA